MHTVRQSSSPWRQRESISAELHEWSLTTLCCKYAHVYGALTATGMQNGVPGVLGRVQWFACVFVSSVVVCACRHLRISWAHIGFCGSGGTSSWSSHKWLHLSPTSTGSWREKRGKGVGVGVGGVERRQREWRGVLRMRMCARVCVCVLKWAVKFCR